MARGSEHLTSASVAGECLANPRAAISLILEYRPKESLRAVPPDAIQESIIVGWGAQYRTRLAEGRIPGIVVARGEEEPCGPLSARFTSMRLVF